MLFCIISWSMPVIVSVIKIPAMICFTKNNLLLGSVKKIFEYPLDRMTSIAPERFRLR